MNEPFGVNIPKNKSVKTLPPEPVSEETIHGVRIKAHDVRLDESTGEYILTFIGKRLSKEQSEMIQKLFPTVSESVYRLLDVECLMAAIVK